MDKSALNHVSDTFCLLSRCFHYPKQPAIVYLSQALFNELAWHLQNLPSSPRLNENLALPSCQTTLLPS